MDMYSLDSIPALVGVEKAAQHVAECGGYLCPSTVGPASALHCALHHRHRRVGCRPSETISHGPIRLAPKAYGRRLRPVAVTCSHSIIPFVWLGVRTAIT
jgi:hypothetical protein